LTPAVTGEPRSNRHYRLNGSGNFELLLCISIGGEGGTGDLCSNHRKKVYIAQLTNVDIEAKSNV
jgi:hypothetical protein